MTTSELDTWIFTVDIKKFYNNAEVYAWKMKALEGIYLFYLFIYFRVMVYITWVSNNKKWLVITLYRVGVS